MLKGYHLFVYQQWNIKIQMLKQLLLDLENIEELLAKLGHMDLQKLFEQLFILTYNLLRCNDNIWCNGAILKILDAFLVLDMTWQFVYVTQIF